MSGHYTKEKAEREIGKSTLWRDARRISIKKWKQIVEYGEVYYSKGERCGYCFVKDNRMKKHPKLLSVNCTKFCPAYKICISTSSSKSKIILRNLRRLKR